MTARIRSGKEVAAALRAEVAAAVPSEPEVVTRISTSGGRHWGVNIGRFDSRAVAERALTREILQTKGEVYECNTAMPAIGAPPATWTAARRDAVLLMLFWALESNRHHAFRDDPVGPFPSTMIFAPTGVPEALHGSFCNPAWERLQRRA